MLTSLYLVCIGFLLLALAEAALKEKVAVIGGGASGLFSALTLARQGKAVTVFEQQRTLGGQVRSVQIKNRAYDLSTMWVPIGGMFGWGIDPCMQDKLDYVRETLEEAESPFSLNRTTLSPHVFAVLEKYSKDVVVDQLVRQFTYYKCALTQQECQYVNMQDPTNFQFPVMLELTTMTIDILRGGSTLGPIPFTPDWSPSMVYYVLRQLGVTADSLPVNMPPSLQSFFSVQQSRLTPWYRFKTGYQTLFDKLVLKLKTEFKVRFVLKQRVTKLVLNPEDGKWTVQLGKRKTKGPFDSVVSGVNPQQLVSILPDEGFETLKTIMAPYTDHPMIGVSLLVEVMENQFSDSPLAGNAPPVFVTPVEHNLGTPQIVGHPLPFVVKRYADTPMLMVGGYNPDKKPLEEFYQDARKFAWEKLGQKWSVKYVKELYPWNIKGIKPASFNAQVAAEQHKKGLSIVGDAVAGAGILPICRFVETLLANN